jgi:hypothetical protein
VEHSVLLVPTPEELSDVVCGAILNNVLAARLAEDANFSPELQQEIIKSSLNLPKTLTPEQLTTVMNAYVFS